MQGISQEEYLRKCHEILSRRPVTWSEAEQLTAVLYLQAELEKARGDRNTSAIASQFAVLGPEGSEFRTEVTSRVFATGHLPGETSTNLVRPKGTPPHTQEMSVLAEHAAVKSGDIIVPMSDFRLAGGIELLDEIGSGGFGRVFRAQVVANPHINNIAVKILQRSLTEATISAFIAAKDTAAYHVSHKNIVRIIAGGVSERHGPFVVMELVAGCNLKQWVEKNGRLGEQKSALVIAQLAEAVHSAHEQGITHRDLKPSNILGCEGPELDLSKLRICDFGLAADRIDADDGPVTNLRLGGGSPPYMPPERLTDVAAAPSTDVFSLAMMLVYLVHGSIPVDHNKLDRVYKAFKQGVRDKQEMGCLHAEYEAVIGTIRDAVAGPTPLITDPVLRAIVFKCLAARPDDRYATAASFAKDLRRWEKDQMTLTSKYSYTALEILVMFFRRCRRSGPEFKPDQAIMWGWGFLFLVPNCLFLSWLSSILVLQGGDPNTVPRDTSVTFCGILLLTAAAILILTRGRGLISQVIVFLFSYSYTAMALQVLILKDNFYLFTQVVFVLLAFAEVCFGFFDETWRYTRPLGYCGLALTPVIILLWRAYPQECNPWGSALMGTAYATLFLVIALSHLSVRKAKSDSPGTVAR